MEMYICETCVYVLLSGIVCVYSTDLSDNTHTVEWYSKQKPTVGGVDISSSYTHRLITAVVACDKADRVYGLW